MQSQSALGPASGEAKCTAAGAAAASATIATSIKVPTRSAPTLGRRPLAESGSGSRSRSGSGSGSGTDCASQR